MPIVSDEKGSVHIEYDMPKEIRALIDRDFLIEFRNQLYRIFDYWALDSFDEEGISMNTSTAGWAAALGKACINTHKEAIYAYWKKLDWYDSDIFDGYLADILLQEKVVLGSFENYLEKYLKIKNPKVGNCCDCYSWFLTSDLIELPQKEAEDEYSSYRCIDCDNFKSGKILKRENKIDLVGKLKPHIFDIISDDLSIDKNKLIMCSKCNLIYTKDLGIFANDEFLCHFCNDLNSSKEGNFHSTDYYRNLLEEIKKVDWKSFEISIGEDKNGKTND